MDLITGVVHSLDHIFQVTSMRAAFETFCTLAAFILQVSLHTCHLGLVFEKSITDPPFDFLDFFGSSHPDFYLIHITALISLSLSNVISFGTIIYLTRINKGSFFQRKIGK